MKRITMTDIPPVIPGKTLEESLRATDMTQSDLAKRTGLSRKTINGIVNGREPITHETSIELEKVFRVPSRFWMNLQHNYDEAVAHARERERLRGLVSWVKKKKIPVTELIRRKVLPNTKNKEEIAASVLRFFGVSSPANYDLVWKDVQCQFRSSPSHAGDFGAISAWLGLGEIDAQNIKCAAYSRKALTGALPRLRKLIPHEAPQILRSIATICARCGVAVVFIPGMPRAPIYGAVRWLSPDKALVQLSMRGKDDGQFWFSLFHELGHIVHGRKKGVILESKDCHRSDQESKADQFACDTLIPPAAYKKFLSTLSPDKTPDGFAIVNESAIKDFARELRISPGIVVGRLQHDRVINWSHCNGLKRTISVC